MSARSRPFSRPVRMATREPGLFGERRDGGEMLARQDLGRRHQRGLAAGLDGARHGQQRHDRLAGADIALQQAQHALGPGQVGVDLGERLLLRAGQRDRAGRRAARPRSLPSPTSGRPDSLRRRGAHQRQRHLAGEELVIGEAPPGRALAATTSSGSAGSCSRASAAAKAGKLCRAQRRPGRAIPAGPAGAPAPGAMARRSTLPRQAGGQRIDRLDQRQGGGVAGQRDMVGMDHGRAAVEPFHAAARRRRARRPAAPFPDRRRGRGRRSARSRRSRRGRRPGRAPSGCRAAAAGGGRRARRA